MMNEGDDIADVIAKEDILSDAIYQFNIKPKTGIGILCDVYDVDKTPESIARLLHGVDGLSDIVIGDWLSRPGNTNLLDAYFDQLDLKCGFLTALRRCLADSLHLPAESDGIDRVLESISRIFCKQNPDVFDAVDHAYILAFSIILLNSDLHNKNHSKKMSIDAFVANCRNAIPPTSINDNTLRRIYNEIKAKPFAFRTNSTDFLATCAPTFRGNLKKRGDSWKSFWTEHYFVLANSCLYYFESDSPIFKDSPIGMIQLVGVDITSVPGTQRCISIEKKKDDLDYIKFTKRGPKKVIGVHRIYLQAPTDNLFKHWLYRISSCVVSSNFANESNLIGKSDTAVEYPQRSSSACFAGDDIVEGRSETSPQIPTIAPTPRLPPTPKIAPKSKSDDEEHMNLETIPDFVLFSDSQQERPPQTPRRNVMRRCSSQFLAVNSKISGNGEEVTISKRELQPSPQARSLWSSKSSLDVLINSPKKAVCEESSPVCDDSSHITLREVQKSRNHYKHVSVPIKQTQIQFCQTEAPSSKDTLIPEEEKLRPPPISKRLITRMSVQPKSIPQIPKLPNSAVKK